MPNGPRVLVAAPDRTMRSAVLDALGDLSALETTDTQTTASLAASCLPDLVVLDATERSSAKKTLHALRSDFRTTLTPVLRIVDSAPGTEAFGATDDYVVCPFEPDELGARVRLSLARSASRRGVSPLTGLPGNDLVTESIASRLAASGAFACLYIDLDDFKAYNDRHGFVRGDELIRAVARSILDVLDAAAPGACFVGHVGGDDFVVLTPSETAERTAEQIVERFELAASGSSISIGVVERADALAGAADVAGAAATAKAEAKLQVGSSWAVGRP